MTNEKGQPWFVAKEVCEVLGIANYLTSIALLDRDEKDLHTMDTLGGPQKVLIINEPGLYSLVLRSQEEVQTMGHSRSST